jgi:hypothetical protein
MICSEISPYLDKTAESDAIFLAKVFFLSVFVGNKTEEKYYANFSPNKEHGLLNHI